MAGKDLREHSPELSAAAQGLMGAMERALQVLLSLERISREKEASLVSGDIEALRAAVEKEEDASAELGRIELERVSRAKALAGILGIEGDAGLGIIAGEMEGTPEAARLLELGGKIAAAAGEIAARNEKLSELLRWQIAFTDYMLDMLLVPRGGYQTYDSQGSAGSAREGQNLLDLRV